MDFHWPVLGHDKIKKYLQGIINQDKIGHAYLFHGPQHIGKLLIAKYFAHSLLCQSEKEKRPCHKCSSCLQLEKGIHSDLMTVEKESDKKNISIQQIRDLQHKLSLKSFLTGYRIVIIDNAELFTEEAANALLKTLEEPNNKTIFFIITNNCNLLPTTIVSRCQIIQFNLVSQFKIENWLITLKSVNKKEAKVFAQFSAGRPGIADVVLNNTAILDSRNEHINTLITLINSKISDRFIIIGNLLKKYPKSELNNEVLEILESWINAFRDMLLINNKNTNLVANLSIKGKLNALAKDFTNYKIGSVIKIINQSKQMLSRSINPRLILENLALNL